jgi:hypothetical protein
MIVMRIKKMMTKNDLQKLNLMDIYSPEGTKVVFLGFNGYPSQVESAIEDGLVVGEEYTVEFVDVGSSCSYVSLKEFVREYNTVMFGKINN